MQQEKFSGVRSLKKQKLSQKRKITEAFCVYKRD
jgi:hypothetical protein